MNETAVIIPKIDAKRLSFALTALVCLILLKLYFDKKERRPQNAALEVAFAGKKVRLLALRDSGNLLRDPLSGRAVAVISKKAAEKLGANEQSIMKRGAKMRVIPVKSVGHTGILYAFIPDTALIDGKKQNICIALDQKNRDFSGFDAIIPSNM